METTLIWDSTVTVAAHYGKPNKNHPRSDLSSLTINSLDDGVPGHGGRISIIGSEVELSNLILSLRVALERAVAEAKKN